MCPSQSYFWEPQISYHEDPHYEHNPSSHFLSLSLSLSLSVSISLPLSGPNILLSTLLSKPPIYFVPLQWETDFTPMYIKWKCYGEVYCNYIINHRMTFCIINIKRANFQICKTVVQNRRPIYQHTVLMLTSICTDTLLTESRPLFALVIICFESRDSVLRIMTILRTGRSGVHISAQTSNFSLLQ
jgi:hypothetical protein